MNSSRFQDESVRPTYMSQAEANDLMELWAERQREEAARQSLITVHDVAEATQLSEHDVERLLQEVRAGRGTAVSVTQPTNVSARTQSQTPTLKEAYLRLAPTTAVFAFLFGMFLSNYMRHNGFGGQRFEDGSLRFMCFTLFFYAFVVGVVTVYESCRRWLESRIVNKFIAKKARSDGYGIR